MVSPVHTVNQKIIYSASKTDNGTYQVIMEFEDQFINKTSKVLKIPVMIGIHSEDTAKELANDLNDCWKDAVNDLHNTKGLEMCTTCGNYFIPKHLKIYKGKPFCPACLNEYKSNEKADKFSIKQSKLALSKISKLVGG